MINAQNAATFIGGDVIDSEGEKLGTVGQIYADATTGEPTWASVKTGIFGKDLFVPLSNAENLEGDNVRVAYPKNFIKGAPRTDVDGALTKDQELALFEHYASAESPPREEGDGPRHREP